MLTSPLHPHSAAFIYFTGDTTAAPKHYAAACLRDSPKSLKSFKKSIEAPEKEGERERVVGCGHSIETATIGQKIHSGICLALINRSARERETVEI